MVLLESPYYTDRHPIALYARKNGVYSRPIIGELVDVRAEDIIPFTVNYVNIVGKLPDIPEANQVGRYFSATTAKVDRTDLNEADVQPLLQRGYTLLPHDETCLYWETILAPWWEFAVVIDAHNGYVKAPKKHRAKEPTPEEIDEQIDSFPENRGKLRVQSPQTLGRLAMAESYLQKLAIIL